MNPTRPARWRRARLAGVIVVTVSTVWCVRSPTPALAATGIALVQKSVEASAGGTSVTATLPASTTAGDLLVATIMDQNSGCAGDSYSAPAGWVMAAQVCRGSNGPLTLWYRANTPSGVTSVTFNTGSSGANSLVELSEWSGVAASSPLDQTGTTYVASSSTTPSVSTSGTISSSGELAVTAFDTSSGLSTFTPGSGWTHVISDPGTGHDSDYLISPTSGATLTETMTSNPQTSWAGAIATFKPGCSGGARTVATSPTMSFPSTTLNGYDRSVSQTTTLVVDDESGTGNGWNATATSTTLNDGSGHTLPTTVTKITGASVTAAAGNCSLPTNSVGYPVTLPAGATPPTAVRVYNAAANTGAGPANVTLTATITIPANARAVTYTATWTLAINSGP